MAGSRDRSSTPFLRRADGIAALLSSLCLIHCLILPGGLALSVALLGVGGDLLHGPEWLHWALLALSLPVSLHALWQGHGIHDRSQPMLLAALGFAAMIAGALLHGAGLAEVLLTVAGGLLVAGSHFWNWRLRIAR